MLLLGLAGVVAILATLNVWALRARRTSPEALTLSFVLLSQAVVAGLYSLQGGIAITSGSATTMFIDPTQTLGAGWIFTCAAIALLACTVTLSLILGHFHPNASRAFPGRGAIDRLVSSRGTSIALAAAIVAVTLGLLLSFDDLALRESYQFASKGTLSTALLSLALPAGVLAAAIFFAASGGLIRWGAAGLFVACAFIELSRASRALAVLFVAAGVASLLVGRGRLLRRLITASCLFVTGALSLIIAIQFRGTSTAGYGVVPFALRLVTGNFSLAADRWESATNNLIASIPITALSAVREVPEGYLATSLSPISGTETAW